MLLPERGSITRTALMPHLKDLKDRTLKTRDDLLQRLKGRLSFEAIDHELRHKALVLVLGGGGGTGYVYIGVMSLLDEYGLKPKLLVGTSIGAVLALFRSRLPRFDQDEIVNIVRTLSWRKLFRVISTQNRYGLPAALRLFLRAGIGRWFDADPLAAAERCALESAAHQDHHQRQRHSRGKAAPPARVLRGPVHPSPPRAVRPGRPRALGAADVRSAVGALHPTRDHGEAAPRRR